MTRRPHCTSFKLSILLHPLPVFRQLRPASDLRVPAGAFSFAQNRDRFVRICSWFSVSISWNTPGSLPHTHISNVNFQSSKCHFPLLRLTLSDSEPEWLSDAIKYYLCQFLTCCYYMHQTARRFKLPDSLTNTSHFIKSMMMKAVFVSTTAVSPDEGRPHSEALHTAQTSAQRF